MICEEESKLAKAAIQSLSDLERLLVDRETRLDAVNQVLEEFNYSVAHELCAPLRRISGFTREIKQRCAGQLDPSGTEDLDTILNSSQQMNELIEALIQLSRLLHVELEVATVDLAGIAASIAEELSLRSPERQVEFEITPQLKAQGDQALLRIALAKLMENGWKFSAATNTSRIEVGGYQVNGRQVYYVRDNGLGFDAAASDRLFHPFQRLHDAAGISGQGLGLTIVKRIVDRHKGELWAEGAPGRGATFYFTVGIAERDC
ncbi:MAG TPA: ATP-binding protein [Geomonas sp.]|nr:ATP-binding protein [Geomonas sp.]